MCEARMRASLSSWLFNFGRPAPMAGCNATLSSQDSSLVSIDCTVVRQTMLISLRHSEFM